MQSSSHALRIVQTPLRQVRGGRAPDAGQGIELEAGAEAGCGDEKAAVVVGADATRVAAGAEGAAAPKEGSTDNAAAAESGSSGEAVVAGGV